MATIENTRPFRIEIPQADLDDLHERLARTRLPRPAVGDDWTYGTPNHYLADMVQRWKDFDWRAVEERLNAFPGFLTEIDGQTVHYLHVRSPEENATPLLLVHSYPGTVYDFVDMIGPLTDPVAHGGKAEDAFHVVVPSTPGYGFSTPLADNGWTMARVARTYDALMRDLGYDSYGEHGSDGGALVGRELGLLEPEGYLGSHVLQAFSFPSGDPAEFESLTPRDHAALEHLQWFQDVGGYNAINASRPQTVGVGISDSPVGLLAWNELFNSFGNGTALMTPDQILAEVTLEWLTNTGATAGRYHYEEAHAGAEPRVNHSRMGVAIFADDFKSIRTFADRDNDNIVHWVEHPTGGHYASLEVPDAVTEDIRTFFRPVR
ncbi:Epoxide hydrolase domain protein [Beutenbergia cavernae DSM 12333]|uniref:Epoxide hydrolase domain protein n=1 Tax=Beutenbergia cavernae (strain ATCC BAA-8 / DSM 12333 / CCUG 43141 / JCM 11478 / NBRC 16432 / NCIMB 13614 / HKI 0122) TaxID=471853 RepID=C5BVH9_BEUC1|nr:epoxide hydrolase family protein [Beutenbergia cavernae]ACQ78419.1 Epoxide hydrolase domain protein [Beutenbergia cavernae DSM 12333]